MTDNFAFRSIAISLYALALAFFVSVSLLSVFHLFILIAFLILLKCKHIYLKDIPLSVWALLAYIGTQLLSSAINFTAMEDKWRSIGAIKYPFIGILGLFIFRYENLQLDHLIKKHVRFAFNIFLATIILAFAYGFSKVYVGFDFKNANDYRELLSGVPIFPLGSTFRLGGFTDVMRYGYGSAIVLLVLLTIILNLKKFSQLNKTYLWIAFAFGFAGLFMSYTRGGMLGFLIGLPVVFFYFNKRLTVLMSLVAGGLIGLMVIMALLGGSEKSRFFLSTQSTSNSERMSQYLSGFHAFQEKPIFGFGPQQLKFHVKEIKEKYNLDHKYYVEHSHNVFIETAANTGILGLIAFLAWITLWIKELFLQHNSFARQMFLPVILFLLVAGQFEMLLMAQTSTLLYFFYSITQLNIFKKETP